MSLRWFDSRCGKRNHSRVSDTESVAAFASALADALGRTANRTEAPRSVILYGSRARGDCRPDSDWDVLAVWADRAERRFAALAFHANAPVIWVNKTRAEVEVQSQQGGSLVRSALAWGRLVWSEPVRVEDWKETRDMNAEQWAGNWRRCVAKGRDATAEALRVDRWNLPPDDYDGALRQTSSDFAEAVAKRGNANTPPPRLQHVTDLTGRATILRWPYAGVSPSIRQSSEGALMRTTAALNASRAPNTSPACHRQGCTIQDAVPLSPLRLPPLNPPLRPALGPSLSRIQ